MPLSSSSLPSFGSSGSDFMASASCSRLWLVCSSVLPNTAGGKVLNIRPNLPSKSGDRDADRRPRVGVPCACMIVSLLRDHGRFDDVFFFRLEGRLAQNSSADFDGFIDAERIDEGRGENSVFDFLYAAGVAAQAVDADEDHLLFAAQLLRGHI